MQQRLDQAVTDYEAAGATQVTHEMAGETHLVFDDGETRPKLIG
ncbi:MAG: hypothetical protein ACR2HR_08300 [Euzebya sp.]